MKNTMATMLLLLCFVAKINAQSVPKTNYYVISCLSTYEKVQVYTIAGYSAGFMLEKNDVVSGFPSQKDAQRLIFYTPKGKANQLYLTEIKYFIPLENEVLQLQKYEKTLGDKQREYSYKLQKIERNIKALQNESSLSGLAESLNETERNGQTYQSAGQAQGVAMGAKVARQNQNERKRQILSLEKEEDRLNGAIGRLPEQISDAESLIERYQSLIQEK